MRLNKLTVKQELYGINTLFIILILALSLFCIYFISCKDEIVTSDGIVEFPDSVSAIFTAPLNQSNQTCVSSSCHSNYDRARGLDLVVNRLNGSRPMHFNDRIHGGFRPVVSNNKNLIPAMVSWVGKGLREQGIQVHGGFKEDF